MKVCFVGVGSIGKRHIKNLSYLCNTKGIELDVHLLRSSHRKLEGVIYDKEFYSIEEIDSYYDAVFITNPTFLHLDTIKKMLPYSDCFFVEKPVFSNTDVDFSFIPESKKIYVACPLRHMSVISQIKKCVDLQDVFHVRSICSTYLPDWRPGTDYRKCYSAHASEGGGVRIDLIHEWDYLTSLFGFPREVYSFSSQNSKLEIDSEDIVSYIAKYSDIILELHLDYFGRLPRRQCELFTEDKLYVIDLINNSISANGEIIYESHEDANEKYISEMKYFLEYINGNMENINDVNNALYVMKLAER
ncbi:MAG: Gfo/Idh/MocA family oxidoreductase [Eubacterium sp.]|nr:Gfo/Idh/MocA family oxidoreductase [Eubacterium sp.]